MSSNPPEENDEVDRRVKEQIERFNRKRFTDAFLDLQELKEDLLSNGWNWTWNMRKKWLLALDEYTEEGLRQNFAYYWMLKHSFDEDMKNLGISEDNDNLR